MHGPGQLAYLLAAWAGDLSASLSRTLGAPARHDAYRLNGLGVQYEKAGDLARAEARFRTSVERYRACLGTTDRSLVAPLTNLVGVCEVQEKHLEAAGYCRQLLDLQDRLGCDDEEKLWTVETLAILLQRTGRYDESSAMYDRLITMLQIARGPTHIDVATAIHELGIVQSTAGKELEAEESYRRALVIAQDQVGSSDPRLRNMERGLAISLHRQGRHIEAEEGYRSLLALEEQAPEDGDTAETLQRLGNVLYDQARYAEAEEMFRRSLRMLEKLGRGLREEAIYVAGWLGDVLEAQNKDDEAEHFYRRVLSPEAARDKANTPHIAHALFNLGYLLEKLGRRPETEECYKRFLAIDSAKMTGPFSAGLLESIEKYALFLEENGRTGECAVIRAKAEEIRVSTAAPRA